VKNSFNLLARRIDRNLEIITDQANIEKTTRIAMITFPSGVASFRTYRRLDSPKPDIAKK